METEDLLMILKPQRTKLLEYLKNKTKVYYSSLLDELKKSPDKNILFKKDYLLRYSAQTYAEENAHCRL